MNYTHITCTVCHWFSANRYYWTC